MSTTPTNAVSWLRHWSDVTAEEPADGIERRMVWGRRLMVCRLRFAPHVEVAVHTHPHEQFTLVERGRVRFEVDGEERLASAGDVLYLPSNVPHGVTMLDEEVVLVDIFSPVRDDFLEGRAGGRGEG
jgi:quercetin dioxygenase-like cupin family protein